MKSPSGFAGGPESNHEQRRGPEENPIGPSHSELDFEQGPTCEQSKDSEPQAKVILVGQALKGAASPFGVM